MKFKNFNTANDGKSKALGITNCNYVPVHLLEFYACSFTTHVLWHQVLVWISLLGFICCFAYLSFEYQTYLMFVYRCIKSPQCSKWVSLSNYTLSTKPFAVHLVNPTHLEMDEDYFDHLPYPSGNKQGLLLSRPVIHRGWPVLLPFNTFGYFGNCAVG